MLMTAPPTVTRPQAGFFLKTHPKVGDRTQEWLVALPDAPVAIRWICVIENPSRLEFFEDVKPHSKPWN
jgi:hypothetical protein